MYFSEIIGQKKIKIQLEQAFLTLEQHAFLFLGENGIGKKTMARAYAKLVLCMEPQAGGSCNHCESCRFFTQNIHADFIEVFAEQKEKAIKVDDIRRKVQADLILQPQFSKRKVYLIDATALSEQGQNILLKSLEEPPSYVLFILIAEKTENLLATLLSRVVPLTIERSTSQQIRDILKQKQLEGNEADKEFLARYANGLPGTALNFGESTWFSPLRQKMLNLFFTLPELKKAELLTETYNLFETQREYIIESIKILQSLYRDLFLWVNKEDQTIINIDCLARIKTMSQIYEERLGGRNSVSLFVAKIVKALNQTMKDLRTNASFEGLICRLLLDFYLPICEN